MKILKKYYIYILELIIGNIIFNIVYSIIKTITFKNIGGTTEVFIENMITSFSETLIVYLIIYSILVAVQILYDRAMVNKLNKKLNKTKERGDYDE